MKTSYFDLSTLHGLDAYKTRALSNIQLFSKIFKRHPRDLRGYFLFPNDANHQLMDKLHRATGLPLMDIEGTNLADEALNTSSEGWYGCTSVGRNGIIGQTLDLYTVALSVVREPGALYVTMPPYLTLMGMSKNLAFCTNHLFSAVQPEGRTPISCLRRQLLRLNNLTEALDYLANAKPMTSVNILLSDGQRVVDVEVDPNGIKTHEAINGYCAHTNHLVEPSFDLDVRCPRLNKAVDLLRHGVELSAVLDDPVINLPVTAMLGSVGFGSIIRVIMDVKNGSLKYRDPRDESYTELRLD